jgi:hypothetical protein
MGTRLGISRMPRGHAFLAFLTLTLALGALPSRAAAQIGLTILTSPTTPLSVSTATAGSQPDASAVDATTGYTAVVLLAPKRIVAKLNSALPAGVTLKVRLQATAGAAGSVSAGYVDLGVMDQTVLSNLTGIITGSTYFGSISYQLVATAAASPFTNTVDVVFSLVDP